MMLLRRLFLLLLIPAFALGLVGMAQARVQAPAAGEIVICSGYGMVTLAVDADGQPVMAVHFCPDCVPTTAATDPGALMPPAAPPLRLLAVLPMERSASLVAQATPSPAARGPPLLA